MCCGGAAIQKKFGAGSGVLSPKSLESGRKIEIWVFDGTQIGAIWTQIGAIQTQIGAIRTQIGAIQTQIGVIQTQIGAI